MKRVLLAFKGRGLVVLGATDLGVTEVVVDRLDLALPALTVTPAPQPEEARG